MIELPSSLPGSDANSINVVADWVELCVVADGDTVSYEHVATTYRDAGLYNDAESDDAGESNRLEEDTWTELRRRKRLLGDEYPFVVGARTLEALGNLRSCPSFALLLLAATAARYPRRADNELPRLFEHVVTASATGLLGGKAARFGWPPDAPDGSGPSSVLDRIRHFARELGLEPQSLGGKVESHDKDIGLDVAARHAVGGSAAGSVVFLIQCATGRNWTEKDGVSVDRWRELVQWNAVPVRAFAVPWWWASDKEYNRHFRRMDHAVVLDRARLLQGRPDRNLGAARKAQVEEWAREQLSTLPRLRRQRR